MNIARWFSSYRLIEDAWAREREEVARLRVELLEWQNKVLTQAKVAPLFQPPPKPIEPQELPPVGPTAKKLALARQSSPNNVPTAEQILGAAAAKSNGNQ